MEINYLAVAAATVAAFVLSSVWYGVLGGQLAGLHDAYAVSAAPSAWTAAAELARSLVVAVVLAVLADQIGIAGWSGAVALGLLLWIGFPAVLLTGSVLHENVPQRLAAIHAGDWLVKLVAIAVIVGVWQ